MIHEGNKYHDKCLKLAAERGYKYAGLQYGRDCWAGNSYGKHGKAEFKDCTAKKCENDRDKDCGGGFRNIVFDLNSDRAFDEQLTGTTRHGDPRACFEEAMKRGYKYAGMQSGGECWIAKDKNPYKYGIASENECS